MLQPHQVKGHDCSTADAATREAMGCDAPLPAPRLEFEGIELDRCPGFYLRNAGYLNWAFSLYRWYEKGFLPYPGTWLEQPNIVIEVIEFIDRLAAKANAAEMKRMQSK